MALRRALWRATLAFRIAFSGAVGVCPVDNDPQCWTAEYTCRRCCDTSLGPEGDASCWSGRIAFDTCCAGRVRLSPPADEATVALCFDTASWLQAGRDPLTVARPTLVQLYEQVKPCTAIESVLHLALLAPVMREADESWMREQALHEAEGILQWFVDSLVTMLGALSTQGFGVFLILHRMIWAVHRRDQGSTTASDVLNDVHHAFDTMVQGPRDAAGVPVSLSSKVALFRRWFLEGRPFNLAVARALLRDATAAAVAEDGSSPRSDTLTNSPDPAAPIPCSLEAALALAAHADVARVAGGARSAAFLGAVRAIQVCLDDVTSRHGPLIKQLMRPEAPPLLLALDRLECKPEVIINLNGDAYISSSPDSLKGNFPMVLLPVRDWESDFVRGYRDVHCADDIRKLVQRRASREGGGLFVDVGGNIGGCSVWAARFMPHLEVMTVEPHGAAVDALNATIMRNGFGGRLSAVRTCVREEGSMLSLRRVPPSDHSSWSVLQVRWNLEDTKFMRGTAAHRDHADVGEASEVVPCRRLDEIVHRRETVLRVHTSGTEVSALASAAGLAKRGLLGAVALQFPSLQQARLLWAFGMTVEIHGRRIPHGDEVAFEQARLDPSVGYHSLLVAVDKHEDDDFL